MTGASTNTRSVTFRAICTNGVFRIRTRATVGPQAETTGLRSLPRRVSAVFQSTVSRPSPDGVIAAATPPGSVAARTFELFPKGARVLAGLNSFFRALVHDANQSASSVFHAFGFSPVHADLSAKSPWWNGPTMAKGNISVRTKTVRTSTKTG